MPECTQTLTVDTATKFCNEHMQVKRAYAASKRERGKISRDRRALERRLQRAHAKITLLQSKLEARDATIAELRKPA